MFLQRRSANRKEYTLLLAVYPTAQEIAERNAEIERLFDRTRIAREAIIAACGGKWKKGTPGTSGKIDCPVCKQPGTLTYSRSGYNGHIHARCKTEGCVSWME